MAAHAPLAPAPPNAPPPPVQLDPDEVEDDEDDALLAEIEALIEQFGADTLAEEFLRYE